MVDAAAEACLRPTRALALRAPAGGTDRTVHTQSSLENIRRLQDRTHDQLVRQGFALPYVITSMLVLFLMFAPFDLQGSWAAAAGLVGCAVAGGR